MKGTEKILQQTCVYGLSDTALAKAELPPVNIVTAKCLSDTT